MSLHQEDGENLDGGGCGPSKNAICQERPEKMKSFGGSPKHGEKGESWPVSPQMTWSSMGGVRLSSKYHGGESRGQTGRTEEG